MKKFVLFLVLLCSLFLVACEGNENIVTFDTNGGTIVIGEETQIITKGEKAKKPTTPTKEGYTFDDWYYGNEKWDFEANEVTENITLSAHWIINQYSITLKFNDGVTEDQVITQNYNSIVTVNDPTREGYTFDKWSETIPSKMPAENKTIEASWNVNQYTLTLKFNDGVTEDQVITQDYNTSIEIINNPTRVGYTFKQWSETIPSTMPAENKTIEAVWKVNHYSITLKFNDGVTEDQVITQDYNTSVNVNNPTRAGYVFDKWSIAIPSKMPAENITIEASWIINQYSITLKFNDGVTEDQVIIQEYNSNIIVNNPTRVGYTFEKWSETIPSTMPAESKIIEAIWKVNQYSITLKYNDGVTSDKVITQDYNTNISVRNPKRTGYTFDKWSETIPQTMPAENKTIEASWIINQYTLTIKYNDGVTEDQVITEDYDSSIKINNPTREGYTFEQWSIAIPQTMPAENKIIEAIWTINQYTLTIKFDNGVTPDKVITQDYKTPLNISLTTPQKLGYTFEKWSEAIPSTMPAENKTIYSSWICDIKYSIDNNEVKIIGYNKKDNIVVLEKYENKTTNEIGSSAFANCISLTNITLPNSITSIGESAFKNCTSLNSITIPDNVTSIGASAFYNCTSLTSVTIPDNVLSIGASVFSNCTNITSMTIGNSVTTIGAFAFSNCTKIPNITIPNSVITIGEYAFSNCTNITSMTIGNSVTTIGTSAFSGCKLTTISLPDTAINLLKGALIGCKATTIEMPFSENTQLKQLFTLSSGSNDDVMFSSSLKEVIVTKATTIGDNAFLDCIYLTKITIPDTVTSIGEYAFSTCTALTSITIPDNVTSIGSGAFSGCTSLTTITLPFVGNTINGTENTYFGYMFGASSYDNNSSYVPSSLKEVIITKATSIGKCAFYNCTSLTSVTIPNSVTSIGASAFSGCTALPSITIPDSVISIGSGAFSGCTALTTITLPFVGNTINGTENTYFGYMFGASSYKNNSSYVPSSLKEVIITKATSIGEYAFRDCTSLTKITIPDTVKSIGNYAFRDCTSLTSITIPDTVKSIGNYAFSFCTNITNITIPDSVISIGSYAFSNCTKITNITLSNSLTTISEYLFFNCKSLSSLTIPNGVISIGNDAFGHCENLASITIPNSVITIGEYAFYYCENMTSITLPNSVTSIGSGAFNRCVSLTSIIIPNSVKSIEYETFANCTSLKSITIPNSVITIGEFAFSYCKSLTSIIIPNSVTFIGGQAFRDCTSLINVTLTKCIKSIEAGTFLNCTSLPSILIPDSVESIENYAFGNCTSLKRIVLKHALIDIAEYAFDNCTDFTIGYIA